MELHVELQGESLPAYIMYLFGTEMDPMASNLPMSVDNSLIVEQSDITVVAGQTVAINLDIRTTNKDLRRNQWFTDLQNSVVCTFSGENVTYSVS
jgi:hypothetical protein